MLQRRIRKLHHNDMNRILKPITMLVALAMSIALFSETEANARRSSYRVVRKPEMPKERWSINVGIGSQSSINVERFTNGLYHYWDFTDSQDGTLSDFYKDYNGPTYSAGSFSLGAEYLVARWFAVSATLGADFLWHDTYDSSSDGLTGKKTGTAISFMPQAKFIYLNRPKLRLYGYIGLGAIKYIGYDKMKYSYKDEYGVHFENESLQPAFQYTPIGVEFGGRLFGFAEAGAGTLFSGIRAGVGYRF